MGIGSITSMNSMSGMQTTMASSTDLKNKNIKKEITEVQQQMRELSSKEELSVNEKANEKKKLQKKVSSLNTELKQHQEELRKTEKRKIMMAEQQEEKPAKDGKAEGKTQTEGISSGKAGENKASADKGAKASAGNTGLSQNEALANGTSNDSSQQAGRVISRSNDGIVILKGAMNQDEKRGVDTEKKLTEESSLVKDDKAKEKVSAEKGTKTSDSDTDTGLSGKEIHAIVSGENSVKQVSRQETVISNISDGIVILKGEINQDEKRGIDTEKKQAELEKMEKREEMARTLQSSVLGKANNAMNPAAKVPAFGTKKEQQVNAENNAFKLFQNEEQESQQRFYVSLGI